MSRAKKTRMQIRKEIIESWIKNNGAATFDLKGRNIILHDGGLFSIEKEIKIKPKMRMQIAKKSKEFEINGKKQKYFEMKFIPIKRNGRILKEKVEYYKAYIWFEELDETVNYFKSMKRMLNKIGFKTSMKNDSKRS